MHQFEMGGYLPIELRQGDPYFGSLDPKYVFEVNTGRTALWCAINSLGINKVRVPYFYCPDILSMLSKMNIQLDFYHIDENLMPVNLDNCDDSTVILVNYFGVIGKAIHKLADRFKHVIIDNAHAFFSEPIMRDGVLNIYSCRKFLGVCDGAYVVGLGIKKPELEMDVSYDRAVHLLKSIEFGTNGAYAENKHNEGVLGDSFLSMSLLTRRILNGIDYVQVKQQRRKNFQYLHRELESIQLLNCLEEADSVPYSYPLLLHRDIHTELVGQKIYVPLLWRQLLSSEWNGSVEQRYTQNIVSLPLDQRYGEDDLKKLVYIVRGILQR